MALPSRLIIVAELDPAIHASSPGIQQRLDAWVKPGHDERN
jgi:hypothetical protein